MFIPQHLAATGLTAELVDKYLNSRTPVNLMDTGYLDIEFTANPNSRNPDRFMLVFKAPGGPLPVQIVSISASRNTDKTIGVNWAVENQVNIENYEVERSADGVSFTGIKTVLPQGSNNGNSIRYASNDPSPLKADNYYRIKANSMGGQVQYSSIVKVNMLKQDVFISVYPNPVVNGKVEIRFVNQPAGSYEMQLSNVSGQVLYRGIVKVTSALQSQTIFIPAKTAAGTFHLKIIAPDKTVNLQTVFGE